MFNKEAWKSQWRRIGILTNGAGTVDAQISKKKEKERGRETRETSYILQKLSQNG